MIALTLVAVTGLHAGASGAEIQPTGVVTTLTGNVTVSRASAATAALQFRDDIFVHDRIAAGDRSMARILFGGKAVVTMREHSILTVTETARTLTVDLTGGRMAVVVAKERMGPGESVDIRTPNAVAGVRGTVVIAEVSRIRNDLGDAPGAFVSHFTVLRGVVELKALDAQSRQPVGPPQRITALQAATVDASAQQRIRTITPEAAKHLGDGFRVAPRDTPIREAPAPVRSAVIEVQVREALEHAAVILGPGQAGAQPSKAPPARRDVPGAAAAAQPRDQSGENQPGGRGDAPNVVTKPAPMPPANLPHGDGVRQGPNAETRVAAPSFSDFSGTQALNAPAKPEARPFPTSSGDLSRAPVVSDLPKVDTVRDLPRTDTVRDLPKIDTVRDLPKTGSVRDLPKIDIVRDLPRIDTKLPAVVPDVTRPLSVSDVPKVVPNALPISVPVPDLTRSQSLLTVPKVAVSPAPIPAAAMDVVRPALTNVPSAITKNPIPIQRPGPARK